MINSNDGQIKKIIESLQKFQKRSIETKQFNTLKLKDFMEPIFTELGYRTNKLKVKVSNKATILILANDGRAVGDFILMSAAIREIRRVYPESYIVMVVCKTVISFAELCPYVNEIIIDDKKAISHDIFQIYNYNLEIAKKLLDYKFDIAYAFAHGATPASPLLAYMSGAKERISHIINQVTQLFSPLLTVAVPFPLYGTHFSDMFLSYLDFQLRVPIQNRQPEVWFTPVEAAEIRGLLPNSEIIYAVCPGGSTARKHWNPEYYGKLVQMIMNSEPAKFIILGGGVDIEAGNIIQKLAGPGHVVNLCGKLTYRQSAAALSQCKICISNDTGLMHVATAFNIPVLTPFCFPSDLKLGRLMLISSLSRYYPYGVPSVIVQPKHALPDCKDSTDVSGCKIVNQSHCINQITPKTMYTAFKLLKEQIAKKSTKPLYFC